jgi:RHS repeat-associated protein
VEDNTLTTEQTTFQNYPTGGNRSSLELFDHTDFSGSVYTRSQLLNGGNNSQVGLSKSLKVYPGDVIHAEVYAKYWNVTSNSSNIAGFAAALTGAFGVTAVMTGEAGKAFSALNSYGGAVAGAGGSGSPTAPKAFITVLLFDNNFNFVDVAYDQIDVNAQQIGASPKAAFDLLVRDVTIKEPGYAYIYVSNENPTQVDVFFDDLSITHTKTNVVQFSEYYPFGMQTSNSWTRENTKGNQFLYNQGTEANATTGWYDLFFRNYDPTLGRFAQVDPLASQYHNQTTYQYGNNDPVYWSDPSGAGGDSNRSWENMTPNQRVDATFDAGNAGVYGASWDIAKYGGGGGAGGSAFARFGPGDGGAMNNFFNEIAKAKAVMAANRTGSSTTRELIGQSWDATPEDGIGHFRFEGGRFVSWRTMTLNNYYLLSAGDAGKNIKVQAWIRVFKLEQSGPRGPKDGPVPYYGNFLGPGPTANANPYNLIGYDGKILRPIDMLDQASQRHDYSYYLANTGGINGALFDKTVGDADIRLALSANMVILFSVLGVDDLVSGKLVTSDELNWAIGVTLTFSTLGTLKGLH